MDLLYLLLKSSVVLIISFFLFGLFLHYVAPKPKCPDYPEFEKSLESCVEMMCEGKGKEKIDISDIEKCSLIDNLCR